MKLGTPLFKSLSLNQIYFQVTTSQTKQCSIVAFNFWRNRWLVDREAP